MYVSRFALAMLLCTTAHASPQLVRVDGSIFDSAGLPMSATKDIQIKAYSAATGGSALWTSSVYTTTISTGRFTINLDASTGSPNLVQRLAALNNGGAVYFEIIYDSGAANGVMDTPNTVKPRLRAKGSIFSLASASTDGLRNFPVSTAVPTSTQVLSFDGTQWAPTGVTTLVAGAYVSQLGDTMSGNLTLPGLTISGVSANYALITDGSGNLAASGLPASTFAYLSGVTANIQTQLDSKLSTSNMVAKTGDTMTGNLQVTAIGATNLSASSALVTDGSKNIISAGASATELGYVSGVTGNIQSQLNGKMAPYSAQTANLVLAGPTTGSAVPTFRALVGSDLPTLTGDSGAGGALGAVPGPAAGDAASLKFLKASGTWGQPAYFGQTCSAGYYLSGFDLSGTPVCAALPTNLSYTRVSAGYGYECGLVSDTTVQCWGVGSSGQLGWGSATASNIPVWVRDADGSKLSSVVDIAAGYQTACALKADGSVWCWGYNSYGNTGNGNTTTPQLAPVQVINVSSAVQISSGYYSTCARISNGTLKCWGYNGNYQLGDGTTNAASTPVQVMGITSAVQVSNGSYATCAVLADGTIRCWGYNGYGELGDGTVTQRPSLTSVINTNGIGLLSGVTMVATSRCNNSYNGTSCAIKSNGQAFCWGGNAYSSLGNGNTTQSYTPVAVLGVTSAVKIANGGFHNCAILNDGTAKCWGYGGAGNLGDNATANRSTPVQVLSTTASGLLGNITDISLSDGTAAGAYFSSGVANGKILNWGDNTNGNYGNNSATSSYYPKGAFGP
ncbi:MAG: hypothetical protein JST16_03425 [Bdellovibrionales bacterium]|nr:hypothetical protein [Bdellovibrionales bacterium]